MQEKKGGGREKASSPCRNHTLCDLGRGYETGKLSKAAVLHRQVFSKSTTVSKSESLKDEVALSVLI